MKMFYQLLVLLVALEIGQCEEHRYGHGACGKAHLRLECQVHSIVIELLVFSLIHHQCR